ncbi:uncharacterized protein LOC124349634 isoform X1 [Daphnia pulicaria]|uniref:uncharacterized protein LOC124349634 isoform X1 n=1 Tax=Daphnia pulicaria TaxID=35523 RepID=UPI001EEC3FB6|nr:uncharacterized protein LOC124349634 isoform X1 [Daphnia pulicaria]
MMTVDDLAVKTFSAGSVALQVNLGRGLINSAYDIHTIQDPEEKALAQRRLDCRKHLLEMRSRNADLMDPESGGQTVMQQEDLQEWLDNLHLKLKQACSGVSTPATGSSGNTLGPPVRPARPSRRSVAAIAVAAAAQSKSSTAFHLPLPLGSTLPVPPPSFSYSLLPPPSPASSSSGGSSGGSSADPSIIHKFKAASGAAVGYPQIIRPRSINGLADQGAAALTDGQYIERLQLALQQASISSLQERLAERKVQSVVQLSSSSGSVRPKTTVHVKSPVKVRRHTSPSKGHHSKHHVTIRPSKLKGTTSSSLPAVSPAPSQPVPALLAKHSKSKGTGKGKTGRSSRHRADEGSADSLVLSNSTSPSSDLMTTSRAHHIPRLSDVAAAPAQSDTQAPRRSFISGDFFNCGQTVDDIYQAAEHLILPPARRDANMSDQSGGSSSGVQYDTGPLIHHQGSLAQQVEEIPIVEDFWGAAPDY